jgi:hypothetical protein
LPESTLISVDFDSLALEPSGSIRFGRIWFDFVETLARNHIDEWLLIRERHQEGTL